VANKAAIRSLLAVGFWFASLFLYVSAVVPLASSTTISRELSVASVVLVALGCVMFRTRLVREAIISARPMLEDRIGDFFRILFWLSLLVMMAIFIGYALKSDSETRYVSRNFLMAPFGFLFFCIGRCCIFKGRNKRYKNWRHKKRNRKISG
jgi:hypothetical protein